jgi:hypothetical protein
MCPIIFDKLAESLSLERLFFKNWIAKDSLNEVTEIGKEVILLAVLNDLVTNCKFAPLNEPHFR